MKNLLTLALVLCAPVLAFAGYEDVFNDIESKLGSIEAASGGLALILEFVLRLVPSEKPLSFAHLGVKFLRGVCRVAEKTADLLDKLLPQNVKSEEKE